MKMRFWQKTYIFTLVIFLICLNIGILSLTLYTYQKSIEATETAVAAEQYYVAMSFERDYDALMESNENASPSLLMQSYGAHYGEKGLFIAFRKDTEEQYSNFKSPYSVEKGTLIHTDFEEKRHILISAMVCDDEYELIIAKNVESLDSEFRSLMTTYSVTAGSVSLVLAVVLYFVLKKLSGPLEALRKTTEKIETGDFSARVEERGNDEFTLVAKSFNLMLDKDQMTDPNMADMSFEDRFGLLVDHEWTTRKNNHLKRLIKNAGFAESGACVENIEYHADRNLDKAQIARLTSCDYITDHHNVMLFGATGSGKTYLACALGMAAVRKFLSVKYIRLPELLTELAIARSNGTYRKVVQQYKKPVLLILDKWLLYPLKETEARDLLEIAEARYKKASTVFCSQFDVPGWRDKIGDPILADAICDRIVHDSYPIVIDCKESMRKRKGVSEI